MDIDNLIKILEQSKRYEIEKVKILRKTHSAEYTDEDISGFSYDFNENTIILFPEYIGG